MTQAFFPAVLVHSLGFVVKFHRGEGMAQLVWINLEGDRRRVRFPAPLIALPEVAIAIVQSFNAVWGAAVIEEEDRRRMAVLLLGKSGSNRAFSELGVCIQSGHHLPGHVHGARLAAFGIHVPRIEIDPDTVIPVESARVKDVFPRERPALLITYACTQH